MSDIIHDVTSEEDAPAGDAAAARARRRIRLIVMGGGYDTRCVKLLERSLPNDREDGTRQQSHQSRRRRWNFRRRRNERHAPSSHAFHDIAAGAYELECYELDLPEVVRAKRRLFERRLLRRRPWLNETGMFPNLIAVDFNDLEAARTALEGILLPPDDGEDGGVDAAAASNVVLFEGVMMYLNEGVPRALLRLCGDLLRESGAASSNRLCFADRLEGVPSSDEGAVGREMEGAGWELTDYLAKPGRAGHMGVARLKD